MIAEQTALAARNRLAAVSPHAVFDVLVALTRAGRVREACTRRQSGAVGRGSATPITRSCAARVARSQTSTASSVDASCLLPADASGFVMDEAQDTFWGLCLICQTTSTSHQKESAR